MIGFQVKISKKTIEEALYVVIKNQDIGSKVEINSFEIYFDITGRPEISIENKCIESSFPVKFQINKNDFLFSIQGHGELNLHLSTTFEINSEFQLSTKTQISKYTWIEEPKIDFGTLNFKVEQLVSMIINHYDDSISSAIDKSIKDFVDLRKVVKLGISELDKKLHQYDFKGLRPYVDPTEILLEPLSTNGGEILAKGAVRVDITVGSKNQPSNHSLSLRWVESLLSDNITYVDIKIEEEIISKMLADFINQQEYGGETLLVNNCIVDSKKDGLEIKMDLDSPIKGKIFIKGIPFYNESLGILDINNLNVSVDPSGFLYKLSAPLLNKFLVSNIKEKLPLKVEDIINDNISKYAKGKNIINKLEIAHRIGKVKVSEILCDDEIISMKLKVIDIELEILSS
jgi:hypothetical protein